MNTQIRCMYTCARLQASISQMGRIVNKVMATDKTRKNSKNAGHNTFNAAPETYLQTGPKKAITHMNRRVTVLNKVFMKHISDLMATGEVAPKLLGRGIELSHVKVAPDFSLVNVYWYANNERDINESTEKVLRQAAGHLQHELSALRIIGNVPPINFVKNKFYLVTKEVENRLAQVDFGEDYVPTAYIPSKNIPVLETKLSPEIKAKIAEIDSSADGLDQEIEQEEFYEISIPEMRQDVMGFDHSSIMKRVKISMTKTKLAEEKRLLQLPEEPQGSQNTSPEVLSFLSSREESKLFDDFLRQRKISEKRRLRALPLNESKLEAEMEWRERMEDDYEKDIEIDEPFSDEYMDFKPK